MRMGGLMRALTIGALGFATAAAPPGTGDVGANWMRHVRVLASDEFQGRLPGSVGEEKTLAYLTREFAAVGLSPGGEVVNGRRTWFQSVPVAETAPPTVRKLSIDGPGGPGAMTQGDGIIVGATQASGTKVDIAGAPLVFVGYGIDAPDYGWDDYKGVDLKGKVAVILFGDPVGVDGGRRFRGTTMSAYGAPRLKIRAALRRGAIGTVIVQEPKLLGYQWATTVNAVSQVRQSLVAADPAARGASVQAWLREDVATRLFGSSGADFATLKARAGERDFRPVPLGGLTFTAQLDVVQRRIVSRSVIGLLPGTSHAGETVLIGAHWDHQGTGKPDATGDRTYNGAIDNASGVATVLEIARATAKRGRPQRSVAFVAWTLEEPGILGSEYYAAHPVFPLETTVATINFDAMIPLGRARDFSQNADPANDLTGLLREAGARQGRKLAIEPHTDLFVRMRSDQAPFVRAGVPSIFYMAGDDLVDGGKARADAWFKSYFARSYHQQSDNYDPTWDPSGIAEDVALVSDLAWRLANSRQWPGWQAGAEFKAVRDRSAGARR